MSEQEARLEWEPVGAPVLCPNCGEIHLDDEACRCVPLDSDGYPLDSDGELGEKPFSRAVHVEEALRNRAEKIDARDPHTAALLRMGADTIRGLTHRLAAATPIDGA